MHTIKTLKDWETINDEDVILDGPFSLSPDDDDEFVNKLNNKFYTNSSSYEEFLDDVWEEPRDNKQLRMDIFQIYAEILNIGSY